MGPLSLLDELRALLETELERQPEHTAVARGAEGAFAFAVDRPGVAQHLILEALAEMSREGREALREVAAAASRTFTENETLEVLTRERVLLRRSPAHKNALLLARAGDREGLRRLPARTLQLALKASKPAEAAPIIEAWNLLPLYEREHT